MLRIGGSCTLPRLQKAQTRSDSDFNSRMVIVCLIRPEDLGSELR